MIPNEYKRFCAQADLQCDSCLQEIPKGDWYYQSDELSICSNCAEKMDAQGEMQNEQ